MRPGHITDTNGDPHLLSPTVFLTAGHCADQSQGDLVGFRIYFQQHAGVVTIRPPS